MLLLMSPFGSGFAGDLDMDLAPVSISTLLTDDAQTKIPKKRPEKLYPFLTDSERAAYLVEDGGTGMELFASNADRSQPIASITKLMTALIILEHHKLDEVVAVSAVAAQTEGAEIELNAGEKIYVRDLIAAILVPSANDAAVALAEHHSGSEVEFVKAMNQKAEEMGLASARFYTSTGLDDTTQAVERYNSMSPRDVIKMARTAWANPVIKEFAQMGSIEIASIDQRFIHQGLTTNQLLGNFQGVSGLKTGFTDSAGQCVVTIARQNGQEVFLVVLGSSDRFRITKQILAWTWGSYVW